MPSLTSISSTELHDRLTADDTAVTIIDIRPGQQYDAGHIPGAINIPSEHIPSALEDHSWDDATEIVVACQRGIQSEAIIRLLAAYEEIPSDASLASLEGGYEQWEYQLEST